MVVGESDTNEAEAEGLSDVLDAFDVDTADEVVEANDTGSSDDAVAVVETILGDLDEPVSTGEDEELDHDAEGTGDDEPTGLDGAFADFEADAEPGVETMAMMGTIETAGTMETAETAGTTGRGEQVSATLVRVPNEAFGSAPVAGRPGDEDYDTAHDEFKALAEEMDTDDVDVEELDLSELTLGEPMSASQLAEGLPESDD
ncbi:hypothetical protein [Haloarchaeobius sp. HME9146]|uniref:hypothetical protein n=1 Tax=Haloarchaeobius sp. HME9146 TaxID=2978732 RepID=UPI0021BF76A5|nr:hypothetical protein [Haloarchaeobius sp. HME9146]MCT9095153.1 hypothetical protein [Haloarchaeobius sp. HME9146]